MHKSIRLDTPIEFINVTPLNPLISKCQIKVCYIGDKPNRNRSIITKDVARQMANSLPGSPIVGYYNAGKEDFEEHNRVIDISNGKFEIKDTTKPYGFVDLNAKVWFAKYLDDDEVEREYMVTEGFLWTGQYPECARIIQNGNNQSMELDEKTLDATWTREGNGKPKFFIINEAIISKLCILGEDCEPCFEGSSITAPTIQFSFEDGFKEQLFSMMNELKDLLNKGGAKVFTRYAVEIGDALWTALYSHIETTYSNENGLMYNIESVCQDEESQQLFAVLQSDDKYYRLNFSLEEEVYTFAAELVELDAYTPDAEPQFALADVEAYAKKDEPKKDEKKDETPAEEGEKCPKCGKPVDECECNHDDEEEEDDKKKKYILEEIPEYVELQARYAQLENDYNELKATNEDLEAQIAPLADFKHGVEKREKEAMINSFYMLTDEDKQDVIANIDTYSLDDIEAKLSVICVRNRVNFSSEDNTDVKPPMTYTLDGAGEDASTPAWVKAAMKVAKTIN